MQRADQDLLLRWALALQDDPGAPAPDLVPERFRAAGAASGLTALVASRANALPQAWRAYGAEQVGEVRARQARFDELIPRVLDTLAAIDVPAIPVKGAVLAAEIWPDGSVRPMSDIDLLVAAGDVDRADAALTRVGTTLLQADEHEHVHLAWGDGGAGRADGESAAHNGKIELHPGWTEVLHGSMVSGGALLWSHSHPGTLRGRPCLRLTPGGFATHVIGHLAAAVVRAEVRPLHVIDAVLVLRSLGGADLGVLGELVHTLDPRLAGPGLWLVRAYAASVVPPAMAASAIARLPEPAQELLDGLDPADVLRATGTRTDRSWRRAFTMSAGERFRVDRQLVWPSRAELIGSQGAQTSMLRLRAARLRRAARRVAATPRPPQQGRW